MKKTSKSSVLTSWHGGKVLASVAALRRVLGEPVYEQNDGEDKVNFEWEMETEQGELFTVYDWKEYRPLREDEPIWWHVGSHQPYTSAKAVEEIEAALETAPVESAGPLEHKAQHISWLHVGQRLGELMDEYERLRGGEYGELDQFEACERKREIETVFNLLELPYEEFDI
jgi:hypothetical protein